MVASQASLSLGCPHKNTGLPFPAPGDLPIPGIEPMSPALASGLFSEPRPSTVATQIKFYITLW